MVNDNNDKLAFNKEKTTKRGKQQLHDPEYDLDTKVIKKINKMYITLRYAYLILTKEGKYITVNTNKNNHAPKLHDELIRRHLKGQQTIGVFSGEYFSSFICFDVDYSSLQTAQWVAHKIIRALIEFNIPDEYIHISFSGNKGYHVEVFFDKPIETKFITQLYNWVIDRSDLGLIEGGQVELRPTKKQGVKLPLGIHFKTGNYCNYCDWTNEFRPVRDSKEYILNAKQFSGVTIMELLKDLEENPTTDKNTSINKKEAVEIEETKGFIDAKYKPLEVYKENIDEDLTLESLEKLYREGLTQPGTRYKTKLKLAKYIKHLGLDREDCKEAMIQWMEWQDKRYYKSSWEECLYDINRIADYTYDKDIRLTLHKKDLEITFSEFSQIMKLKKKNEKLLLFSIWKHSKRFADATGVFYMTYLQMEQTTGLTDKTVRNIVNSLEKSNAIEIVSRNVKVKDSRGAFITKMPNRYRVNIKPDPEIVDEPSLKITDNNDIDLTYIKCLIQFYPSKQIKKMLGRREYEWYSSKIDEL